MDPIRKGVFLRFHIMVVGEIGFVSAKTIMEFKSDDGSANDDTKSRAEHGVVILRANESDDNTASHVVFTNPSDTSNNPHSSNKA